MPRTLQLSLQHDYDAHPWLPFFHYVTTSFPGSRPMTLARYFITLHFKAGIPRKGSGSLIASTFGIETARQHLGHRDIRTTSELTIINSEKIA